MFKKNLIVFFRELVEVILSQIFSASFRLSPDFLQTFSRLSQNSPTKMTSVIQNRSVQSYFTNVDNFSTKFLVYGEARYGEHNTMFTGYTYGKPSFGKQNYLQFLKDMDCETIEAAHDCFEGITHTKKQTPKASMEFAKEWHQKFNSNLHSSFINPDFLEGRTSASQIHCKVTFPGTKEERT